MVDVDNISLSRRLRALTPDDLESLEPTALRQLEDLVLRINKGDCQIFRVLLEIKSDCICNKGGDGGFRFYCLQLKRSKQLWLKVDSCSFGLAFHKGIVAF